MKHKDKIEQYLARAGIPVVAEYEFEAANLSSYDIGDYLIWVEVVEHNWRIGDAAYHDHKDWWSVYKWVPCEGGHDTEPLKVEMPTMQEALLAVVLDYYTDVFRNMAEQS
jgi:hypothetical protein